MTSIATSRHILGCSTNVRGTVSRVTRFLLLPVLAACTAFGQTAPGPKDHHLNASPAQALYRSSAWAHGYIHGYEWGFHYGGFDFHLARSWRDIRHVKQYKDIGEAYRPEYGDKDSFVRGYRSGFEVGYADAYTGHDFRAAEQARSFVADPGWPSEAQPDRKVSVAMDNGYKLGRTAGLADGRNRAEYHPDRSECPGSGASDHTCPAFLVGYKWGYSDGYNNQMPPEELRRQAKR